MARGTRRRPLARKGRDAFELLRAITEATAANTGQAFFDELVRRLAAALGAKCAFVSDFSPDFCVAYVRAFWMLDHLRPPFEYDVPGTPCEHVLAGEIVAFDSGVQDLFPMHRAALAEIGAESYLAIPLRTPSGSVCGHLAVIDSASRDWQDVDFGILRIFAARATAELERREYEASLEAANRDLGRLKDLAEAANRAKSDFLASMSHELRTPLNGILGYAQILKRDPVLDASLGSAVAAIERCGEHLLALINDVLDLAKIEAGVLEIAPTPFDLVEFVDGVLDLARLQATRKGLAFRYECASAFPSRVESDERRLRQILLNLLSNAIKFTSRGSVTLRVGCQPQGAGRAQFRFDVVDTGPGIEATELERIFEMFQQSGERRQRIEGAGLGLAISRRLAHAMGGEIQVQSTVGAGSCFTLALSLTSATASPGSDRPAQPRTIIGYHGPRRRVLVVDDISDNREIVVRLLDRLGFEVLEAADGRAAIDAARLGGFDAILMDLVMPRVDGFEAARQIRELPGYAATAMIALSASVFDQTQTDWQAAGFAAFLTKPLRFPKLLDALGDALGIVWIEQDLAPAAERSALPVVAAAGDAEQVFGVLLDLAKRGDVRSIEAHLARLSGSRQIDDLLLVRLRELAARFDMRGLRSALAAITPTPRTDRDTA